MRGALLLALLLWGCSSAPEADLPSITQARSLGAEWALVKEQAARGKLTAAYPTACVNSRARSSEVPRFHARLGRSDAARLRHRDELAHLEPGEALGDPASPGQGAEV